MKGERSEQVVQRLIQQAKISTLAAQRNNSCSPSPNNSSLEDEDEMNSIYHTQGHCNTSQPGIPEQVTQHLNLLRLENLMAPRWSIVLNEHGCQLQVYWRAPNAPEKDQVQCNTTAESEVPPAKKPRKQDLGTPRSNGINNGGSSIQHHQPIRTIGGNGQMRRPAQGQPIGVRASPIQLGNQFNAGFGRPPPSSPKFTPKAAPPVLQSANVSQVSPPKINIPNQALLTTNVQRMMSDQLSPKSFPTPVQNQTPSTSATKIDNKRPGVGREPRKSIEATALMLMEDRLSFTNNTQKIINSPPEFDTPPGSERSLSGDGKETQMASQVETEQTQQALEFAMNDMYRQKFSCEICHKTFTRKYSLSRHYKEVHQGESRSSKFQASALGPSLLAINSDRAGGLLNDFGVLNSRVQFPPPLSNDSDVNVKIEECQDDDDSPPSMVLNRSNPTSN